jgi:serine/threonine-protein kinase RsbW
MRPQSAKASGEESSIPGDRPPLRSRSVPRQASGMSSPNGERTLKRTLPSSLDAYHDFVQAILDELTGQGWTQSDLFGVHMALEESISNAIRHGNKYDPGKHVEVECRVSQRGFWARICDEGSGFRPADVPDCCSPECLELPGGRGLALINAYMTRVEYNDCGNCVTLEKRLGE